jgi:isovaleryl-CoA dehydrogenase
MHDKRGCGLAFARSISLPTDEHKMLAEHSPTSFATKSGSRRPIATIAKRVQSRPFSALRRVGAGSATVPGARWLRDSNRRGLGHGARALSTADPGFALAYLARRPFREQLLPEFHGSIARSHPARVVSGEWIGGMCMTEPEAGTDVLGMRSQARREGDHYVLDGRKTFITNGAIDDQTLGDVFLVYAKTSDRKITSFIVEKGFSGFALGQRLKEKLGMRASMTADGLRQLRVPANRSARATARST